MTEILSRQKAPEGQPGETDERRLLGLIAVRERRQCEALGETLESRRRVGPRREALPGKRQLFTRGEIEAFGPHLMQDLVQREPVKTVEVGPWQVPTPHPVHRRHVQRTPRVGQPPPIGVYAVECTQSSSFCGYTRAPVHSGAEHVEGESADIRQA